MKQIEDRALRIASDAFLREPIPEHWNEMSEEEREDWVDSNRSEVYEGEAVGDVFNAMTDHAMVIAQAMYRLVGDIKDALIDAGADDRLPLELHDLDVNSLLVNR
jgi:hypothetical protein